MTWNEIVDGVFAAMMPWLPWQLKLAAYTLKSFIKDILDKLPPVPTAAAPDWVKDVVGLLFDRAAELLADYPMGAHLAQLFKKLALNKLLDKVYDYFAAKGWLPPNPVPVMQSVGDADFNTEVEALKEAVCGPCTVTTCKCG